MPGDPILGAKLRRRRRELGLTQLVVATDSGIDRSHLANVEAGRRSLGTDALVAVAQRLNLSLDFLAAAEGEDPHGAAHARNEAEAVVLALVRSLSPDAMDALIAFLESQVQRNRQPN